MPGSGEVVTEALEASRARERLLTINARPIGQAVGVLVEALSQGQAVHVHGEGHGRHLAAYLAESFFTTESRRPLRVRPLPHEGDLLLRAVETFVSPGDVVLFLALSSSPWQERALQAAQARRAPVVLVVTQEVAGTLPCELEIVVPHANGFAAVESFLALGHVLCGLVAEGLERFPLGADGLETEVPSFGVPPSPLTPTPPAPVPAAERDRRRATRVFVKDTLVRWSCDGFAGKDIYVEPYLLEDLSLTGLRFIGRSRNYEVGDLLFLEADFPAFPDPIRVKGQVRRIVKLRDGHGYSFAAGVRFVQFMGDSESRIRRLVNDERLRAARRR